MHTDCEYWVQTIPDFILDEEAVPGFLNPNGNFKNKSKRRLYIYSNEGRIPHCHYIDKAENREICVRLDKVEYFTHGTKQTKFTATEKKMFIAFMKYVNELGIETWKFCVNGWNGFADEDDSNMDRIKTTTRPDYSKLETET